MDAGLIYNKKRYRRKNMERQLLVIILCNMQGKGLLRSPFIDAGLAVHTVAPTTGSLLLFQVASRSLGLHWPARTRKCVHRRQCADDPWNVGGSLA